MRSKWGNALIWFSVLAMLVAGNGHLLFVQGIGWAGMLVRYCQESGSMMDGVQRTFSGEEPCSLCKTVVAELDQEPGETAAAAPAPEFRPAVLTADAGVAPPRVCVQYLRTARGAPPPNPCYQPRTHPS